MAAKEGGWGQLPRGHNGGIILTPLDETLVEPPSPLPPQSAVWEPSSGTVYVGVSVQGLHSVIVAIDRDGAPRVLENTLKSKWPGLVAYGHRKIFGVTGYELFAINDVAPAAQVHYYSGDTDTHWYPHQRGGPRGASLFRDARGLAINHAKTRLVVWESSQIYEARLSAAEPFTGPVYVRRVPAIDEFAAAIYAAVAYSLDDRYLFALRGFKLFSLDVETGERRWIRRHLNLDGIMYRPRPIEGLLVDRDGSLVVLARAGFRLDLAGNISELPPLSGYAQRRIGFGPEGMALIVRVEDRTPDAIEFKPINLATDYQVAGAMAQYPGPRLCAGALLVALSGVPDFPRLLNLRHLIPAAVYQASFAREATEALLANAPDQEETN